jgi:ribosome-associated translation inhibitor RaiA
MDAIIEYQVATENWPVPPAPLKGKKAKCTKTQRDTAKGRTEDMWAAINEAQKDYRKSINKLAEKFNR